MQDKRYITLSIIVLAVVLTFPVAAIRFVSIGITEGDWLNDWGLIDHGWIAGGLGFISDVLAGRVGVDYPWEDTLPGWVAEVIYAGQGIAGQ